MKYYVLMKTSKEEIFPDVISIKETFEEALEALYQEMDKNYKKYYKYLEVTEETKKEIQEDLEEYHYFDFKGYRYNIMKYWE